MKEDKLQIFLNNALIQILKMNNVSFEKIEVQILTFEENTAGAFIEFKANNAPCLKSCDEKILSANFSSNKLINGIGAILFLEEVDKVLLELVPYGENWIPLEDMKVSIENNFLY